MADNEGPTIEGLLAAYGCSKEIPVDAKIRLQQSLDLEKRLAAERDHLEKSRDEVNRKLRQTERKYQDLFLEMNKLKLADRSQVSELESELKLKKFDLGRLHILYKESEEKYQAIYSEKDRLAAKVESLEAELLKNQMEADKKISELTLTLQYKSSKLETYEKLEAELDQLVIDAAAAPADLHSGEMLDEINIVANMPCSVKRRMQQCFDLAKRVFSLERTAAEQKADIFQLRDKNESLRQELHAARDARSFGHEPTSKLINVIMLKNMELTEQRKKNIDLETRIIELKMEMNRIREELKSATSELEKSRKSVSFGPTSVTTFYRNSCADNMDSSQSETEDDSFTSCSNSSVPMCSSSNFSRSTSVTSNISCKTVKPLINTDILRLCKPLVLSKVPECELDFL